MPCEYDHKKGMYGFKTVILIGGQFKFLVDDSRHMTSQGYDVVTDAHGNTNNIFLPSQYFEKFG